MTQITPAATATAPKTTAAQARSGDPMLDKNMFLKLMMTELQNQDPLSPNQDPTQYMQQLAQFTSLEQETNIAQSSAATQASQAAAQAVGLIGHTIGYIDANGNKQTGSVQSVQITSNGPTLTVGAVTGVTLSSIFQVS
jgi:flagellar basal-body rod modification protein FlgD